MAIDINQLLAQFKALPEDRRYAMNGAVQHEFSNGDTNQTGWGVGSDEGGYQQASPDVANDSRSYMQQNGAIPVDWGGMQNMRDRLGYKDMPLQQFGQMVLSKSYPGGGLQAGPNGEQYWVGGDGSKGANPFGGMNDSAPSSGIMDAIRDHGYLIPLALATAGSAGLLGGGEAAGEAAASLAPDASWGVNPQGFGAPMSTTAQGFVNPATLATEAGAPMSTTGALSTGASGYLPTSAAAIGGEPFSLSDFAKKIPTSTGNSATDNLLTKAATTALGAGNQATAGGGFQPGGGDTLGADQQAADEARKQSLIEQINGMYDPKNFAGEESGLSDAIRGQQGDALKLGYEKAARATTFDAARRGNVGGSVMADNISNLNRDNQLGSTKIEEAVQSALAGLRSSRLASQSNAIGLVNAGSGPEAVNAASTGIKNAIDTAQAAKVPDVTQGLFQNVALSNNAINTGTGMSNQAAYINQRLNGGGTLFPLGSNATGRNVAV